MSGYVFNMSGEEGKMGSTTLLQKKIPINISLFYTLKRIKVKLCTFKKLIQIFIFYFKYVMYCTQKEIKNFVTVI